MTNKNNIRDGLAAEIRIIPVWAWALAALVFIIAQVFFQVVPMDPDAPTAATRALLGTMGAIVVGCYLLFIGYVSRDARRRDMSALLWVLIIILIPNGLGLILYFLLRKRLPVGSAQVGQVGQVGQAPGVVCPRCACVLSHCPSCGNSLAPQL